MCTQPALGEGEARGLRWPALGVVVGEEPLGRMMLQLRRRSPAGCVGSRYRCSGAKAEHGVPQHTMQAGHVQADDSSCETCIPSMLCMGKG